MNISKSMLQHSAIAFSVMGMNADRQPVYSSPVELHSIWIDLTDNQVDGTYGKENSDNGTFYFDCVNSSPSSFVPEIGMKIVFDSTELSIKSVKKCYGLKGLEHFECGVS